MHRWRPPRRDHKQRTTTVNARYRMPTTSSTKRTNERIGCVENPCRYGDKAPAPHQALLSITIERHGS